MSNNAGARAEVVIVIDGQATGLEGAIDAARAKLAELSGATATAGERQAAAGKAMAEVGAQATHAAEGAEKLSAAEQEAGASASMLEKRLTAAAEAVGFLGAESSESIEKMYGFRSALGELQEAMGGATKGILALGAGYAAFKFVDVMRESIDAAMEGEQAQARLNAAFAKTPETLKEVTETIERSASSWATYGDTIAQVKDAVATAAGRGLSAQTILGNPQAIADMGQALHTNLAGVIDDLTKGQRSASMMAKALNLNTIQARELKLAFNDANLSADQRAQALFHAVESSSFAGQGTAAADTTAGKFAAFTASMDDLKETLGNGVLPLVTNFATVLNTLVQGANTALQSFGGLSGVLSQKWIPYLVIGLTALKGTQIVLGWVENLFRSKLIGDVQQTTQAMGDEVRSVTALNEELSAIPPTVETIAIFDATAATAVKEPYIANVRSVPLVAPTTAVFDNAAAVASIADEEGAIAGVPRTLTTTALFDAGAATVAIADEEGAIAGVPRALTTVAAFDSATAETSIAAYDAKVATVPPATTTTASFNASAAEGDIGAYEGQLAAIPRTVSTVATFTPAAVLPTILVSGAATITSVAIAAGALKPLNDAIGHLVGAVSHVTVDKVPPLALPGVADVARATVKKGLIVSVDAKAAIGSFTVPKNESVTIKGKADVTSIQLPKGTTYTVQAQAQVKDVMVAKGTTLSIKGNAEVDGISIPKGKSFTVHNIHGTVEIENAMVAPGKHLTINNVAGTAVIQNVIPASGKHLTISGVTGTAQIDGVSLKKGAKIDVSGGSATIDTINAKRVKVDIGPLGEGLVKNEPIPLYVKPVLAPGAKWPTPPNSGSGGGGTGGGGGGFGGVALDFGESMLIGLAQSLLLARVLRGVNGKGITAGLDNVKKLFGGKDDKGPPAPPSAPAEQDEFGVLLQQLEAVPDAANPADPHSPPPKPKPATKKTPKIEPATKKTDSPKKTASPPSESKLIFEGLVDGFKSINWGAVFKTAAVAAGFGVALKAIVPPAISDFATAFKSNWRTAMSGTKHTVGLAAEFVSGLASGFKSINWGSAFKTAGAGLAIAGALATLTMVAFGDMLKLLTSGAGIANAEGRKGGQLMSDSQAFVQMGKDILSGIAGGIRKELGVLASIGKDIIAGIVNAIYDTLRRVPVIGSHIPDFRINTSGGSGSHHSSPHHSTPPHHSGGTTAGVHVAQQHVTINVHGTADAHATAKATVKALQEYTRGMSSAGARHNG